MPKLRYVSLFGQESEIRIQTYDDKTITRTADIGGKEIGRRGKGMRDRETMGNNVRVFTFQGSGVKLCCLVERRFVYRSTRRDVST